MELTPTIVNIGVFGVILLSAIFAYARGVTREMVTLAVWAGAAIAALKFYPKAVPLIQDFKDLGEWTKWAALVATFVVALIVLTIVGSFFARIIANSPLRVIDKGIGFLFGMARGVLILAVCWIGLTQLVDPQTYNHDAVNSSKGGQLVKDSADYLMNWMPKEMPPFLVNAYEDFMGREIDTLPASTPSPAPTPSLSTGSDS